MFRSLLLFSLPVLLVLAGCGHHQNERMPSLGRAKDGTSISRDTAQSVELAIQKGEADQLAALLATGFPVNAKLNTGLTPLQQAIVSTGPTKFEKVFRILMEKGADPSVRDADGNDALKLSESKRVAFRLLRPDQNADLVRQFFEEAEAEGDRSAIVALFKEKGEDVNLVHPDSGHTPLTRAIELRSRRFFAALMEQALRDELDVDKPGAEGKTPLRLAKETNWNLAVGPLTDRGAKEN